jgi:hypothetical protein
VIESTLIQSRFLLFFISLLSITVLCACDKLVPLNSERIKQQFGSYGVEIIEANERQRVTSLYSVDDGIRTTRTLALVNFVDVSDKAIADVHREILNGGSIGAEFKTNGWIILKETVRTCALPFDVSGYPSLAGMRIESPAILALHEYRFRLSKQGTNIHYATIIEIHHPDYLDLESLTRLHPDPGGDCTAL